jgi:hypothetical protein
MVLKSTYTEEEIVGRFLQLIDRLKPEEKKMNHGDKDSLVKLNLTATRIPPISRHLGQGTRSHPGRRSQAASTGVDHMTDHGHGRNNGGHIGVSRGSGSGSGSGGVAGDKCHYCGK